MISTAAPALACGLAALVLGACSGPRGRTEIAANECYALAYEPDADADSTLFPRALTLTPGEERGPVASGPGDGRASAFWGMFGGGAEWRRLPGDSLGLAFSNGYSETRLVVAHDGRRLRGIATFRFDEESEPYPRLALSGARVDCAGDA